MFRIAVIGCGYWGPNLIRNFQALTHCEMAMVCDTSSSRLEAMKKQFPELATTQHADDVIQNPCIDAIAICTPIHTHYQLAKRCLEQGKHTLVEKPMANSTLQCEELIHLAHKHSLILMVGHTFLYSPVVRKIKEIVDSDELGEIQYISSRRLNLGLFQKDFNVAWDLAPHDISIILYLTSQMPVSIHCHGKAHVTPDIEDVTNITLDFESGCFASIHNSWLDPNKIREMTLVGTRKMLLYDDIVSHEKIKIYDKHVEKPPYYKTYGDFHYSYHYGDTYSPYVKQSEPLRIECEHFLDCIQTGKHPLSNGEQGWQVVHILEKATESLLQNGNRIFLDEKQVFV